MRALVTGATGFAGTHLMEELGNTPGVEVYGTTVSGPDVDNLRRCDLMDSDAVTAILEKLRPEIIYHLAAFASPALSFRKPVAAVTETLAMQINLYQACLDLGLRPRIVVVSTGQIYDVSPSSKLPLPETSRLGFTSPYAIAKAGQENVASMYARLGIESVIARPFNHIGPGQQPGYLVADLAKQVAELERTGEHVLRVGNLSSRRDFTDVRDIVRAYVLLAAEGRAGEAYNVCSGSSHSGEEILAALLRLSHVEIRTEQDPEKMRPADIPDLRGDPGKIKADTGWAPRIPLEQTLRDTLRYWRENPSR